MTVEVAVASRRSGRACWALAALALALAPGQDAAPSPVPGPTQVLEVVTTVYPPFALAVAERGESTLAGRALDDVRLWRLVPHGDVANPAGPAAFGAYAPGGGDGTWQCADSGGTLVCQLWSRAGTAVGQPVQVFGPFAGHVSVSVASDAQDRLAVAWRNYAINTQDPGTVGLRLLDAWGGSLSAVLPGFEGGTSLYSLGAARFPAGGVALVTEKAGPPRQLWAQLFDSSGVPGTPWALTAPPQGDSDSLAAVASAGSGFAVLWSRLTLPGPWLKVLLQRFDAAGQPLSAPSVFFEKGSSGAGQLSLGCDGWGRCVAVSQAGLRTFDAQGQPATAFVQGDWPVHALAASPSGAFTLTWGGAAPTATGRLPPVPTTWGIYAGRYQGPPKGDLDADQSADLLLQHVPTGALALWAMSGATRIGPARPLQDLPGPGWLAAGVDDFDGDWRQDILLWNSLTGAAEVWRMGGPDGTTRLGVSPVVGVAPLDPTDWRPVATGDLDADGKPDVLWQNEISGALRAWALDGTAWKSTLTPDPDRPADPTWRVVAAADFDGDGRRDLLWHNPVSGKVVYWHLDSHLVRLRGTFASPAAVAGGGWVAVASGEFGSGTGRVVPAADDIVWRNSASGRLVVWHMDPSGRRVAGGFTLPDAPTNPLEWRVAGPR